MTVLATVRWRKSRQSPVPSADGVGARSRSRRSWRRARFARPDLALAPETAGRFGRLRPVLIAPAEGPVSIASDEASCAEPAIEVEFAGKTRVRIPASIPAELAAAVVKALARR